MSDPCIPPSAQRAWEDLILAMLAVSLYPLERVLLLRDKLRQLGLLEPSNLARYEVGGLTVELKRGGYDRGRLTSMYADRLVSLGKHAEAARVMAERVLLEGDDREIRDLLMPWHGIGEKVLSNFFTLRRSWRQPSPGSV